MQRRKKEEFVDPASFLPRIKECLRDIGYNEEISRPDIVPLHLIFLSQLEKLWAYDRRRLKVMREDPDHKIKRLAEITQEQQPIVKKAYNALACEIFIRRFYDDRMDKLKLPTKKAQDEAQELYLAEYRKCRQNPVHFLTYYGWMHEPRLPEVGLPSMIPFIMYPKQQEIFEDIHTCWRSRQNLLVEKSREAGISWIACAYVVWQWIFTGGFTAILASEKEEKVDQIGSMKPLFGKIRYILYHLPAWMLPAGFQKNMIQVLEPSVYDNHRRIQNPDNRSEITGEAGVNIGRSGRASIVIIDESQEIQTADLLDRSLESVTNCRVDIGTPKGMNHFGKRRFYGGIPVSTINWFDDPRKNPKWKDACDNDEAEWKKFIIEKTPDKTVLAQEYFLDYAASVEDSVIPSEHVKAAVGFDLKAEGEIVTALDVADTGTNKSIYTCRIGPVVQPQREIKFTAHAGEAAAEAIRQAEKDGADIFNFDRDAIGVAIPTVLGFLDERPPFKINAIRGAETCSNRFVEEEGKTADKLYKNRRAEVYYTTATRFRKTYEHRNKIKFHPAEDMISIPNDPDLILQLSQPKKKIRGSKKGVESKAEMKSRGVDSPDKGDSCVYTCADDHPSEKVVSQFDYTSKGEHYKRFDVDLTLPDTEQFVSIYQTPDLEYHGIGGIWYNRRQLLQLYWEYSEEGASPFDIVSSARTYMQPALCPIREWIANDEMFKNVKQGRECPYYHFKKAGVILKQNYRGEVRGDIMTVNDMFAKNMIQINDPDCQRVSLQIMNWTKQHSKPTKEAGLALSLSQLVSRLKYKKKFMMVGGEFRGYGRQPLPAHTQEVLYK